jgi:cytochrome c oxidase subunit 2
MTLQSLLAIFPLNDFFGIPKLASQHGEMVDHMLELVHWFMTILFIGWSVYLIIVLSRFRQRRNPKADYVGVRGHASTHIEIGVIIVEAILVLGFALPLWGERSDAYPTGSDVLKLRAVGEKFQWTFQYPGVDGVLGRQDIKLVDTNANNPIGRDMKDANGTDDFIQAGTLTLPKDRPVIIDVTSKDVIHNLALIPMRIAQDATPGVRAHIWFKPTKTGDWDIICGQLCGPGHASMRATLSVVEQKDFDAMMKEKSEAAVKQAAAGSGKK